MKRFILLALVVLFIGSFLGGCNGVAYSHAEHKTRFKTIHDMNNRQLVDDLYMVALCDRVSYMSEWPIRDTD